MHLSGRDMPDAPISDLGEERGVVVCHGVSSGGAGHCGRIQCVAFASPDQVLYCPRCTQGSNDPVMGWPLVVV